MIKNMAIDQTGHVIGEARGEIFAFKWALSIARTPRLEKALSKGDNILRKPFKLRGILSPTKIWSHSTNR